MNDPLAELAAAIAKIDDAVAAVHARAGDAITCARGCARCCVLGLSVLPVEAALIEASGATPPAHATPGMCAFLDERGDCTVYAARPVLCRTHGLALKTARDHERALGLRVLGDDVEVCALNYRERTPAPAEILDATRILMLLVTVDRRFRARVGLPDDDGRVPLVELAQRMRA
ncbi:MAG: YkgJ family cysteine cluster protein [Deltaproteobacteria bacterium]|nr:YkgJ family cysteine cluster protein [Deltaproteobacteria bacterium]